MIEGNLILFYHNKVKGFMDYKLLLSLGSLLRSLLKM